MIPSLSNKCLEVTGLSTKIVTPKGEFNLLNNISFSLARRETLVIVGESGCGKSMLAKTLMKLLPQNISLLPMSKICLNGNRIDSLPENEFTLLRGKSIAMVAQDPGNSLNPVLSIQAQLIEAFTATKLTKAEIKLKAVSILQQVGLKNASEVLNQYPHQLSGGMQQRVLIAISIANNPNILIADEPTTALDVTTQMRVLHLLQQLQVKNNMGLILVTHDMHVARMIADQVAVMYAGQIVEINSAKHLFQDPLHPYTKYLLAATPSLSQYQKRLFEIPGKVPNLNSDFSRCRFLARCLQSQAKCYEAAPKWQSTTTGGSLCHFRAKPITTSVITKKDTKLNQPNILVAKSLQVSYKVGRLWRQTKKTIISELDLALTKGTSLALVGESGSGKTTLAKTLIGMIPYTSGTLKLWDKDYQTLTKHEKYNLQANCQIIFQDLSSALNPRMMVGEILQEGINNYLNHKSSYQLEQLLTRVGLDKSMYTRFPHQLSGGQKQRLCIARALAINPQIIICDEITSSLDSSVQAQILNLLLDLQQQENLTYIFISHDLGVVANVADFIAVMHSGNIVEYGTKEDIILAAKHPFTQQLINFSNAESILKIKPSTKQDNAGCSFYAECPHATQKCANSIPELKLTPDGNMVRCFLY